jgi:hypothetical protein
MTITNIIQIILAVGLLFFGRRLYWAFVGAIGFIAATEWALTAMQGQPEWLIVIIGLAVGLIGALLAVFLRAAAIGLAGFLGGAYIFLALYRLFEMSNPTARLVMLIVGGLLGLIVMIVIFDWALIVISAASGALLLANYIPGEMIPIWIVTIILFVIGVIAQAWDLSTHEPVEEPVD